MKNSKKLLLIVICFVGLFACEKDLETKELADEGKLTEANGDRHLIEAAGYDISNLTYNEKEDEYTAEGDILITRAHLDDWKKQAKGIGQKVTNTYLNSGFVDQEKVKNIVIGPSIYPIDRPSKIWLDALKKAIEQWNAIPECKIHLIYADYSEGLHKDIKVTAHYKNTWCADIDLICTGPIADASFPRNGQPGNKIRINKSSSRYSSTDINCKVEILIHEIGHTLGFGHLGKGGGLGDKFFRYLKWPYVVEPYSSDLSIMYKDISNRCNLSRRVLKHLDHRMAQIAYPRDGMFFSMSPTHSHSRFGPLYEYLSDNGQLQDLEKDYTKQNHIPEDIHVMGYISHIQQILDGKKAYNAIYKYLRGGKVRYSKIYKDSYLLDQGFVYIGNVGFLEKKDFPQFPMSIVTNYRHKTANCDRLFKGYVDNDNWEFQGVMGHIYTP